MKQLQFATMSATVWEQISLHQKWIEETLGVPLSDALQMCMASQVMTKLAAAHILPKTLTLDIHQPGYSAFLAKVRQVSLPPNVLPSLTVSEVSTPSTTQGKSDFIVQTEWHDCPVALHFEGLRHPVVFLNVPHNLHNKCCPGWQEVTVLRRDSVASLVALIQECISSCHVPSIHYFGSERCPVATASWEDIVMDETATMLLRHDFESFFQRKAWFHANRLPFRRGYLLHGPPGNGKTSVIRAMLSHHGLSGHAINLMTMEMDDNLLQKFFSHAADDAPALIILEDVDRLFFGPKEEKPNVSLQQLLNCLDGVGTQDGMVVVATANHPEVLDTAILRRPGRFDRVIEFGNPTKELRGTYLQKMCPALIGGALDQCIASSEGLSFAQLRESYILAGQRAFEEGRDVLAEDVTAAITQLQRSMDKADKRRTQKSGFDLQGSAR